MKESLILRKKLGLILLGLCLILFLFAVTAYNLNNNMEELVISEFNEQQLILAKATATGIENYISAQKRLLNSIGQGPIKNANIENKLPEIYSSFEYQIQAVFFEDEKGYMVRAYPEDSFPEIIGQNFSYRTYFKVAKESNKPYVTDFLLLGNNPDLKNAVETILITTPVLDERGSFQGVLGIVLDLEYLANRFIRPVKSGETGYAFIVNDKDEMIVNPSFPSLIGRKFEDIAPKQEYPELASFLKRMIEKETGTGSFVDLSREKQAQRKLGAFAPINLGDKNWSVAVVVPYDEALGLTKDIARKGLLLALMVIGVFIAGGVVVTKSVLFFQRAQMKEEGIHKLKVMNVQLNSSKKQLTAIIEGITEGILSINKNNKIFRANNMAYNMLGLGPKDLIGKNISTFIDDGDIDLNHYIRAKETTTFRKVLSKGKEHFTAEISIYPIEGEEDLRAVVIIRDVSVQKSFEEQIKYMAYYDSLTTLPNRRLFNERLLMELARAKRNQNSLAIMFLDLDDFKSVNDTLGHGEGDRVLSEISKRLKDTLRDSDTVARIGGDEFSILLPEITNQEDVRRVLEKLQRVFEKPILMEKEARFVAGVSIGVAIYPQDGVEGETLLNNADLAMYFAKSNGGNTYKFYTEDLRK